MKYKIIDLEFLIKQTKKFVRADDFIWSLRGTNASDIFYEWDIKINKNFEIKDKDDKKYPTRGWFYIARDFYNQQKK